MTAEPIRNIRTVWAARSQGYTWGRIGRLLGMTRQGADKRFPGAPPAAPPNTARALAAARERRETARQRRPEPGKRKNPRPYDLGFVRGAEGN